MVIAFLNLKNNISLVETLITFVKKESIDILILAEYKERIKVTNKKELKVSETEQAQLPIDISEDFLLKSQTLAAPFYDIPYKVPPYLVGNAVNDRLKIMSTYPEDVFCGPKDFNLQSSRWTAFHINLGKIKINLFPLHFQSKLDWSDISQAMECTNLANDIVGFERAVDCDNTILIGDFNMNPFEPGIVSAIGLNARPDKTPPQKNKTEREVDLRTYKHFYNPMWNFFGDFVEPTGTYYFSSGEQLSHRWNIFDQVMIRDGLKSHLDNNSIKIVTEIGEVNLLTPNNIPNENKFSDHLPIIIKLNNIQNGNQSSRRNMGQI